MTVIIAGLGAIGRQIASRLLGLGVRVVGVNRPSTAMEGLSGVISPEELPEAVANADALVVALPGTDATHKLVDAEVFRRAKPGLTVVNVGRGTVIDEEALIAALDDGQVGFAALDVFYSEPLAPDSPLWTHPNVLVSPHTAGLVESEDEQIADLFVANATRLLDGEPMLNRVNTVEFY